ncbi:chondroitinase-B domain-containing protein [Gramella sp. AN32]|uniref:Chondroitinase-B domain-containing protein n=1 Tax=Christiangramia antarctica TaxID=2058158 RepID=A0ABW5X8T3_9FLAO|nr:chondroitinase-B domain-containing protein [Gramella sp. AN32]MCM4155500.1 alginate lyase [Gramella sp. AN32]
MKAFFLSIFLVFTISGFSQSAQNSKSSLASNVAELEEFLKIAVPGDTILMANGTWDDAQLEIKVNGKKDLPVTIMAEERGKVFLEGQSSLKIGGSYIIVDGLIFQNGYTPDDAVIQFKINNDQIANNSRVTNCVIENFTQPSRETQDHWIEFWGRNNQMDHCYIAGKSNSGPTLRIYLKGNENINTHHQIINNYFGPRPRKGGPHAETMQIGSSETSMTPAYVNVANNLFYRCNGEVEIISSKSNFNNFKNNVFFESEGSLVLRHGNYANIDGNIFIGNDNSEFIGGIRVINTGHWITNNYFYNLKGSEFRSPLAVMNGIPKSPLNRYNQVTDVVAAYNSFVDTKSPWHFSVGSNVDKSEVLPASEIRSARPERVLIANNLVYNQEAEESPIVAYDTVDGVTFKNNILNYENKGPVQNDGIITKDFEVKKVSEYLYVPDQSFIDIYHGFDFETIEKDLLGRDRSENNSIGAIYLPVPENTNLFDKANYGPAWFQPEDVNKKGKVLKVTSSEEFLKKLEQANSGDILELAPGNYKLDTSVDIAKRLTIRSQDKKAKLKFTSANIAAFKMHPKGSLKLENIILEGNAESNAFETLDENMSVAYNLWIKDAEISDFNQLLKVSKGSFADTISIKNSNFRNLKQGIALAEEIDDKGEYNAEFVYITDSNFENIQNEVLNYYRGGYDESTIGGTLVFTGNTVKNSGTSRDTEILLRTRGVVNLEMANNTFIDNEVKYIAILWGAKGQEPVNNTLRNSGEIKVEENLKQKLMY